MSDLNLIQSSLEFIEQHITESISCADIAKQVGMSQFHFQRLFSIICSCTVGEYIRNRRLSLAAIELETTDTSIIDIALQYGYDTPEGFTRAFHRYFGVTPSAARDRKMMLPKFEKISVQKIIYGGMNGMVIFVAGMKKERERMDAYLITLTS